jgi:hypothetical protein
MSLNITKALPGFGVAGPRRPGVLGFAGGALVVLPAPWARGRWRLKGRTARRRLSTYFRAHR